MVLAAFGLELSEHELCVLCDCTLDGTDALKAVDAARQLGFPRSGKHTLNEQQLRGVLATGLFPIVYLSMIPLEGVRDVHAVVVLELTAREVVILDPAKGEWRLPLPLFNEAWRQRRNLAILIEP